MPCDPNECRLHGRRCAELASTAKTEQWKAALLEVSTNWVRLAESLERAQALLEEEKSRFQNPRQGDRPPS